MMRKYLLLLGLWLMAVGMYGQQVKLDTLKVQYVDFQGQQQQGVLICNTKISKDLQEIFAELYRQKYPIERILPISEYDNDDERSMRANNTSCYCYHVVEGSSKLSKHAQGMAIDINPLYNPCVNRSKSFKYKITSQDLCYRLIVQHGFRWGGNWRSLKDYQHFEK